MENLSKNQWGISKGVGWLLGISISIVGALVVHNLSGSFSAAVSAALPIAVFAGISLEQKFQRRNEQSDYNKTKMMISALLFGFVVFITLYIILHLL